VGRASAYLRLVRPGNAAIAGLGALAGAIGAMGRGVEAPPVLLAMAAATLGVAGGNALNDALDADIDRSAHPGRPIPRGELGPAQARRFGVALILLGVAAAALVNAWTLLLALLLAGNLLLYEFRAKSQGLLGHVLVSYNAGALFVLGGLAAYGGPLAYPAAPIDERLLWPLAMAALALLLNLARELYKAAEDAAHDAARRATYAVRAGPRRARQVAGALSWATVPLALLPAAWPTFSRLYAPLVAPLLLLLIAVPFLGTPRRSRAWLKVGMWLGLVPFVVPKLI
jgi:geranylgeranylglycerol-phosphate geranylgeranyltransferase